MHAAFGILGFFDCAAIAIAHYGLHCAPCDVVDEWADLAMAAYSCAEMIPLRRGTRKLLERLHSEHVPMGIATSNWRGLAEVALRTHKLESFFSVVVTSDEVLHGKPKPDVYELVAHRLGMLDNSRVLVVEDNYEAGVGAAGAGMKLVACKEIHANGQAATWPEFASIADWTVTCSLCELLHNISFTAALGLF